MLVDRNQGKHTHIWGLPPLLRETCVAHCWLSYIYTCVCLCVCLCVYVCVCRRWLLAGPELPIVGCRRCTCAGAEVRTVRCRGSLIEGTIVSTCVRWSNASEDILLGPPLFFHKRAGLGLRMPFWGLHPLKRADEILVANFIIYKCITNMALS